MVSKEVGKEVCGSSSLAGNVDPADVDILVALVNEQNQIKQRQ
jgi:hypothetical protein